MIYLFIFLGSFSNKIWKWCIETNKCRSRRQGL